MSVSLRGAGTRRPNARASTSSSSSRASSSRLPPGRRAVLRSTRLHSVKSAEPSTTCTGRNETHPTAAAAAAAAAGLRQPNLDRRAALLGSLAACALAVAAPAHADEVKLAEFRDNAVGYSIAIPEGWTNEAPGGQINFYPPHDYAGKRVTIQVSALGKKLDLDLSSVLGSPQQYGQSAVQGMETELLSTSQAEGGRYYYYEYTLPSFNPNRVWGVAGVGLGSNATARQYNRKQLVKVTCMVPEEDLERDGELMRNIVSSFHFLE